MVPVRSICLIMFRDNLPSLLAVSSPNNKATKPWEISWIITEKISIVSMSIKLNIVFKA